MDVEKVYHNLSSWFRGVYRKGIKNNEGQEVVEEALFLLEKIAKDPYGTFGLETHKCPHCDRVIYIDKDEDVKKCGLIDNYFCNYCGVKALDSENNVN